MEMRSIKLMILFSAFAGILTAQTAAPKEGQDLKAKAILDDLSKKTKAYTSVKAEFSMTMESKDKKTKETQTGKLQLKGDKYKLEIKGQDIITDGKTMWTVLRDAKETQVKTIDKSADEGVTPSNIFTIYEKGYKYKFESEKGNIQTISLFPIDPGTKKFHTIKLDVDKAKKQISGFKVMMKDGSVFSYLITKFSSNAAIADGIFGYDPKNYQGFELIDLRD